MDLGAGIPPDANSTGVDQGHDYEDGLRRRHSPGSGRKRKLQLEGLPPSTHEQHRHRLGSECAAAETAAAGELPRGADRAGPSGEGGSTGLLLGGADDGGATAACKVLAADGAEEEPDGPASSRGPDRAGPSGEGGGSGLLLEGADDGGATAACKVLAADGAEEEPDGPAPGSGVDQEDGDDGFVVDEECKGGPIQALMLSGDGGGPNAPGPYAATSWSTKQGALPGDAGPTIDREFEHYFSMFMPWETAEATGRDRIVSDVQNREQYSPSPKEEK